MERIRENEVTYIERIHDFYCDECGQKILESKEYEDGYYEDPDDNIFVLSVSMITKYGGIGKTNINTTGSSITKMLCNDCALKLKGEFQKHMSQFGFKF